MKNAETKEHPCFVPYEELPPEQQAKDHLFKEIVGSLASYVSLPDEAAGAAVTDEVVADVADATGTASEDADSTSEVSGESANSTGDGIEAEEARE